MISVSIVALVLVPGVWADATYDAPAPPMNAAPGIRGLFSRGGGLLALVAPGADIPDRCCATLLNRGQWPSLPVDRVTRQDLMLLLPVDSSLSVQDLHVQIAGQNGLGILTEPAVLFLDEPTRGPDLPAKRDTWKLLRELAARDDVTTFLSSHDAQEIRSLCTRISVIAVGPLVFTGATGDIGDDLETFEEGLVKLLTDSHS